MKTLVIMKERNVVLGIVSGPSLADVEAWEAAEVRCGLLDNSSS